MSSRNAVGNGDGSESIPPVAKITAPARGSAAQARGSWVAAAGRGSDLRDRRVGFTAVALTDRVA